MDEETLKYYEALFSAWEAEQAASDPGDDDYCPEEAADWLDELNGYWYASRGV